MEIVGGYAIARALRKESRQNNEEQTLPIARRPKEYGPSLARRALFYGYGLLDLDKFGLYKVVMRVAVGVILRVLATRMSISHQRRTLTRTLRASSALSLEHSHRGLSGSSQMRQNCMNGMRACSPTGILQAALPVYLIVPKIVHAATMDPTYQRVLYMVVTLPRCWG